MDKTPEEPKKVDAREFYGLPATSKSPSFDAVRVQNKEDLQEAYTQAQLRPEVKERKKRYTHAQTEKKQNEHDDRFKKVYESFERSMEWRRAAEEAGQVRQTTSSEMAGMVRAHLRRYYLESLAVNNPFNQEKLREKLQYIDLIHDEFTKQLQSNDDRRPSAWGATDAGTVHGPAEFTVTRSVEAMPLTTERHALVLGQGAAQNIGFLVGKHLTVTAVIEDPQTEKGIKTFKDKLIKDKLIENDQLVIEQKSQFGRDQYDLISASNALCLPSSDTSSQRVTSGKLDLERRLLEMKASLRKGGLFCGQLPGQDDQLSEVRVGKADSANDVRAMFSDMKIIHFKEVNESRKDADGNPKQHHYFEIVAQKPKPFLSFR